MEKTDKILLIGSGGESLSLAVIEGLLNKEVVLISLEEVEKQMEVFRKPLPLLVTHEDLIEPYVNIKDGKANRRDRRKKNRKNNNP